MDAERDQGESAAGPVPPGVNTSQPSSSFSWSTVFKSPEFMLGLQTAVSQVINQGSTPTERASQLEMMGNPSQVYVPKETGQVGDSSLRQSTGTFVVPPFVNSVNVATESQTIPTISSMLGGVSSNINNAHANLVSAVPDQNTSPGSAFILGPGRAPIPAKLVKRIVSHEFIEMSELSPESLEEPESELPLFTFEGTMVVPKSNAQKKNAVIDILTWVECFNSYTAVLTTYFPSRSRDLLAYMALIIRTAKRFRGKAWLDYDRAFRREAAATNLRDWSVMRPDLYNYHTAVVNQYELARNAPNVPNPTAKRSFRDEPQGKPSSNQFCISWNRGFCVSSFQTCRFRHNCSYPNCNGSHRLVEHERVRPYKRDRSPQRTHNSRRAHSK